MRNRTKKRIWWLILILAGFLVLYFLPHSPRELVNAETGLKAENVYLTVPFSAKLFAPFLDFPFYFYNFAEPKIQLFSWLIWFLAIWLIVGFIKLRSPPFKKCLSLLRGIIVIIVSFLLFVLYLFLFPLPQYSLNTKNPNEIFLDLHSHTIYSHDGSATLERSILWHLNCGFNGWATTEHEWIGAAPIAQEEMLRKNSIDGFVIAGEEINFKGSHINALGIKKDIDRNRYKNLADLVKAVHQQKGVVIVPHFWGKRKPPLSLKELAKSGVDGFEIAGNSSRPLKPELKGEIINLCREKNLLMVGGTNWHGWGSFCNIWTGFKIDNHQKSNKKIILNALRKREVSKFRVITYQKKFYTKSHYFFEPFIGTFSYLCSLNNWQRISWFFWIFIICFLLRLIKDKRQIAIFLWLVASLTLLAKGISFLNTYEIVNTVNNILPGASRWLFLMAGITLILAFTDGKGRK